MQLEIFSEKYVKDLDDWLFKNDQRYAKNLAKVKNVPPMFLYSGKLYRGMVVDQDFLDNLNKGKVVFKDFSSWTKNKKVALKFINDPKYRLAKSSKTFKIIIEKQFSNSDCVLDINAYVLFTGGNGLDDLSKDSALKEEEVLIKPNVKLTEKDIEFI